MKPGRNLEQWEKRSRAGYIKQYPPIQQDYLNNFEKPNIPDPIENAYIFGKQGTGKTVYATFMMLEEQKNIFLDCGPKNNQDRCTMISVPELFNKFKASYAKDYEGDSESKILQYYQNIRFLVLDDFGSIKPSDWTLHLLYSIIDHRINWKLMTVYTSNFDLKQVEKILGDSRITSRIDRSCILIEKQPFKK